MISKETARVLIGLFLYIPLIICPAVVIITLLRLSRNAGARVISIFNLIFASGAVLIVSMATSGARWAGSQPRPHPVTIHDFMNARGIIMIFVVLCWFAGAIGLFFRKRIAWIGSLIGVAASVFFLQHLWW
jgi:hypothetical protein